MITDPVLFNDWHPVAHVRDFQKQNILTASLLEEDLVIWQLGDQVMAWQDLCVHRGTRLSLGKVTEGALQCPYHGWRYDVAGKCIQYPAHPEQTPSEKAQVKTYRVKIAYDLVWVCPGTPQEDVPFFPEWSDHSYRKILFGPYKVKANGFRLIEGGLDVAHFPYVHAGILGDPSRPEIPDYKVLRVGDTLVAEGLKVWQPDPYGTGVGDWVTYIYTVLRPLTTHMTKGSDGVGSPGADQKFATFFTVTPIAKAESIGWMWVAMNYGHDIAEAELVAWQDAIFEQDRPVIESQRPELLPLDLQAELHLRSDKMSIAYRKWLTELGLSFGTA